MEGRERHRDSPTGTGAGPNGATESESSDVALFEPGGRMSMGRWTGCTGCRSARAGPRGSLLPGRPCRCPAATCAALARCRCVITAGSLSCPCLGVSKKHLSRLWNLWSAIDFSKLETLQIERGGIFQTLPLRADSGRCRIKGKIRRMGALIDHVPGGRGSGITVAGGRRRTALARRCLTGSEI